VVALHAKGDFFGEGCLTGQRLRLATVVAMTDLEVMRFDNAAIQRVLHAEPSFSELFITHLLERNARVEADLVDQLFITVPGINGTLLGVLKLRHSLQSLLGGTRQNELVIDKLELRNRDGDIVLHQAEKTARIDDGI
jgi:CRP-like cAMP-binding protein